MYAKLNYAADPTNDSTKVLADIAALLQGETVVANLTGNILSGTIDVSYKPVAWTLFDTVGTTKKVFKIPVIDDPTAFIYVELDASSTVRITMTLWDTWDAISHTGTKGTYSSGTIPSNRVIALDGYATQAFTVTITATDTHCLMRSVYNAGTISYMQGMMQYNRGEPWDTVAAGTKPAVITEGSQGFIIGRVFALEHKRSDGAFYSGALAILYSATRYGNSQRDALSLQIGGNSGAARGLDANGNSVHNMYEFGFSYTSNGERFMTGKINDMYLATYQNGAQGDLVVINNITYMIWECDANNRVAVRMG